MGVQERVGLYERMERLRQRPLLVYVTSSRPNASGQISSDVIQELLQQLPLIPDGAPALDLLLVSNGGDPTVAWRIVSLLREKAPTLSVLIPQAAFSAATLIALGADEIVMHPHGNLGPTDVQMRVQKKQPSGEVETLTFGTEDLAAFLKYVKDAVGVSDQQHLKEAFLKFCDQVGTSAIGVAARSQQLGLLMGQKLLQLHMTGDSQKQKAKSISEKLTRDYFHHGYPVSRSEAKEIGLKVADSSPEVESLMWEIWSDLSEELELRIPFFAIGQLATDPNCAAFMTPAVLPAAFLNSMGAHVAPAPVPAAPPGPPAPGAPPVVAHVLSAATRYETIAAVVESARMASRFVTEGTIAGIKQPPQNIQVQQIPEIQRWKTVWVAPPPAPAPAKTPSAR
jgi:hypothetical protein